MLSGTGASCSQVSQTPLRTALCQRIAPPLQHRCLLTFVTVRRHPQVLQAGGRCTAGAEWDRCLRDAASSAASQPSTTNDMPGGACAPPPSQGASDCRRGNRSCRPPAKAAP